MAVPKYKDLEETFPENPMVPSIAYAACTQTPITIPWSKRQHQKLAISLGTGFESSKANTDQPFCNASPLNCVQTKDSGLVYTNASQGTYAEVSTNSANSASEHMQMSVAASIGGSFLGASGEGRYEKSVLNNRNSAIDSIRSKFSYGQIVFARSPSLSREALALLREKSVPFSSPEHPFRRRFGDYYVAALILGGSNATMVSAAASSGSSASDFSAKVTVKILFVKKTKSIEDHDRSKYLNSSLTLDAFDSLDDVEVLSSSGQQWAQLESTVESNCDKAYTLDRRVESRLLERGLRNNSPVSEDSCRVLGEEGVVSEILLLPYSGMRDFIEITCK